MRQIELLEKSKNKILNLAIILLALFISFRIYQSNEEELNKLSGRQKEELKKNEEAAKIAGLEKKDQKYRQTFGKKNMGSVIEAVSDVARNSSVKIISVKPAEEEVSADYTKSSFSVTVSSPDYHSLANFISQIESKKDIYMFAEVSINSVDTTRYGQDASSAGLSANLKITTISY